MPLVRRWTINVRTSSAARTESSPDTPLVGSNPSPAPRRPNGGFTDPYISTVGTTKAEAEEAGTDTIVGKMPFIASGRAIRWERQRDLFESLRSKKRGRLVGAQIVGPDDLSWWPNSR